MSVDAAPADFAPFLARYHAGLDAMARGDNGPGMALYSPRPDVVLANPLGPPIVGWDGIAAESARVAARFAGGSMQIEVLARYVSADHAWTIAFERAEAIDTASGQQVRRALRVTTVFRREDGKWRIALRHADTIGVPPA